ncbi:FAD binding domain-containing protein, partial [bacterium]|nr:FAD binding domain-containing protein [bacterium]
MPSVKELIRPSTPAEAVAAFRGSGGTALYIAGGTILVHATASVDTAVDVTGLGAGTVRQGDDGSVVIGAATRISDLARSDAAAGL